MLVIRVTSMDKYERRTYRFGFLICHNLVRTRSGVRDLFRKDMAKVRKERKGKEMKWKSLTHASKHTSLNSYLISIQHCIIIDNLFFSTLTKPKGFCFLS